MTYHSAYRGIAKAPNGDFDHLVRQIDPSHVMGGHWRFQSVEDDRRAMNRGFTTPEAVLCAVECNEDEDEYDDIIIRWVRGENDSNVRMALSGTATQHLETIYELRALLGLPLSSRGQIPLYPISTNPRLKQYWDTKHRLSQPVPTNPAGQLPDRPIPSPLTSGPGHSGSPHSQTVSTTVPKSSMGPIESAGSAEKDLAVRPTPAVRAALLQERPDEPVTPTTQATAVRSLSADTGVLKSPTNTIGRQQAPFQSIVSPASMSIPSTLSGGRIVPSIPRTALAWGLQSSPLPTQSSLGHGISQHNWIHSSSRNSNAEYSSSSAIPYQLQEPNSMATSLQNNTTASSATIASSNIPYRSLCPTRRIRDGLEQVNPADAQSTPPLAEDVTRRHVVAPCSATPPTVSTVNTLTANIVSSSEVAPMAPSTPGDYASEVYAYPGPSAARNITSSTSRGKSQQPFLDGLSSPVAQQASPPPPRSKDTAIKESLVSNETSTDTHDRSTAPGRGDKRRFENDANVQSEVGRLDMYSATVDDTSTRMEAAEAMPEPWGTYMRGLAVLPCMDCGEDDGHQMECNLGNIEPMRNLTVLDYRILADAVKLFDPGPWTTHFNPPEPEPEDAEAQMRGMAEVIRNEDSYKNDAELHKLPDEFMIMLWAFKTSDKVQVVKEHDCDSGIGESGTEG